MENFDLIVIGAGPGGYTAAIRAAQLGAKVALVERQFLGGTCLNWGCIPTKALVASADFYAKLSHAKKLGVMVEGATFSWPAILKRKNKTVKKLRQGVKLLLKSNNVAVLAGLGQVKSKNCVAVTDTDGLATEYQTKNIILATGSEAAQPSFFPFESPRVIESKAFLDLAALPQSIIIVGGGVVGCEIASVLNALDVEVTLVEMLDQLLPTEDHEVVAALTKTFTKNGIKVLTGTAVSNVVASETEVTAKVADQEISAELMLVAIGRTLNTENIGLTELGLVLEKGAVKVNQKLQTSIENIYAIGDITNKVQLAHVATSQAMVAAEVVCGQNSEMDYNAIPNCIFCMPEIASVGITEQVAREQELDILVASFPYAALGKAVALEETAGFFKVIADKATDKILGVHIYGAHATDIIGEATLAMNFGIRASQIGKTIHAHPTLGEGLMEAMHSLHGQCINLPAAK